MTLRLQTDRRFCSSCSRTLEAELRIINKTEKRRVIDSAGGLRLVLCVGGASGGHTSVALWFGEARGAEGEGRCSDSDSRCAAALWVGRRWLD